MEQMTIILAPVWYGIVQEKSTKIMIFREQIVGHITNINFDIEKSGLVVVAGTFNRMSDTNLKMFTDQIRKPVVFVLR
jgi:hypothetical protein